MSSGPKQLSHTYLASRGYVASHSLQISASGAIRSSLAFPSLLDSLKKKPLPGYEQRSYDGLRSHLPGFPPAGIGTFPSRGGCRGFNGPVPPPLWMWQLCAAEYTRGTRPAPPLGVTPLATRLPA